MRINFYLLRTFCPHLGRIFFCVVSSFTTFRPNFTSGLLQVILPRPRIGMLSLVTVSPVITAFHSCCLSHQVFDQVNLWPAFLSEVTSKSAKKTPRHIFILLNLFKYNHNACIAVNKQFSLDLDVTYMDIQNLYGYSKHIQNLYGYSKHGYSKHNKTPCLIQTDNDKRIIANAID